MTRILKFALPSVVLAGGFLITQVQSFATPAYAKKEKTGCTTCHVAAGKKDLNDVGKCYKSHDHADLKSCDTKK